LGGRLMHLARELISASRSRKSNQAAAIKAYKKKIEALAATVEAKKDTIAQDKLVDTYLREEGMSFLLVLIYCFLAVCFCLFIFAFLLCAFRFSLFAFFLFNYFYFYFIFIFFKQFALVVLFCIFYLFVRL
jgi:hypothetical protein